MEELRKGGAAEQWFAWRQPAWSQTLTSGAGFPALSWRAKVILWVGLTLYQLAWRPKAFLDPIGFFQGRQLFVSFLKNGGEVSLSLPGFIPS